MADSDKTPPPMLPPMSIMPSNSTLVGLVGGGGGAATIVWVARQFFGVELPPDVAVWLGSLFGALVGYPFKGGRR
jgi:hypothetical protein